MKIGIIIGSTRPGRVGASVGQWVYEQAAPRESAEYELVDLADFELDLLNEPTVPGEARGKYENPKTTRWSQKISEFDGFVFVTPEYNHSVPAAFKNAFDVLFKEWNNKVVALVSYGADSGVRAVEHWRLITANAHLYSVRGQLSMNTFTEFEDGKVKPNERRPKELQALLNSLEKLVLKIRG